MVVVSDWAPYVVTAAAHRAAAEATAGRAHVAGASEVELARLHDTLKVPPSAHHQVLEGWTTRR